MLKDENQNLTTGEKLPRVGYTDYTSVMVKGDKIKYTVCIYDLYYSFREPKVTQGVAVFISAIKGSTNYEINLN